MRYRTIIPDAHDVISTSALTLDNINGAIVAFNSKGEAIGSIVDDGDTWVVSLPFDKYTTDSLDDIIGNHPELTFKYITER